MFSRHAAPLHWQGIQVRTLKELKRYFSTEEGRPVLCSDLSLGSWRGNHVAQEFAAQLGVMLRAPQSPTAQDSDGPHDLDSYSDTIGLLIDAESSGDKTTLQALEDTERICAALDAAQATTFAVLLPRFGNQWRRQDLAFLGLLHQALEGTHHRVILVHCEDTEPALPAGWHAHWTLIESDSAFIPEEPSLLRLIPGLISEELRALEPHGTALGPDMAMPLRAGMMLVAPELRSPALQTTAHLQQLAQRALQQEWLHAYAVCHGEVTESEASILSAAANRRAAEGAVDIALDLLERLGGQKLPAVTQAASMLRMQSLRIATLRFKQAAEAPLPPEDVPAGLRGALFQCKAWGLVMDGEPAEAEQYFAAARELLAPYAHSRYFLYLLNISALNKLRLGDMDTALAFEKQIEAELATLPRRDWHLLYINWLNLARIYKAKRQLDEAETYYERAFSTHVGLRAESDLIYINLCWAQLFALKQNPAQALVAWLRTALHWLATPAPEALAPRVATAILSQPLHAVTHCPEQISRVLRENLENAARQIGLIPSNERTPPRTPPVFTRSVKQVPPDYALGAEGWGVLCYREAASVPSFRGEHTDTLRHLAMQIMRQLSDGFEDAEPATIVVDAQIQQDIPSDAAELLGECLRHRIHRCTFAGKSLALSTEEMEGLEQKCMVRISPALDHALPHDDGLEVYFKRYRAPRMLSHTQSNLLHAVGRGREIGAIVRDNAERHSAEEVVSELRTLEAASVLEFLPPGRTI